jgi:hypothetical protein
MNVDWPVFVFGLLVFLIGSIAILLGYAAAAAEEAEHERGPLAQLTLQLCRILGLTAGSGENKGQDG